MSGGSAERMRRYRERQRRGACIVRVPVYPLDVAQLVQAKRLRPEETADRSRIGTAIELLVDDFAKGWLVGTARAV